MSPSNPDVIDLEPAGPKSPSKMELAKSTVTKVELVVEILRFLRSHTVLIAIIAIVVSTGILSLPEIVRMFYPQAEATPPTVSVTKDPPAEPRIASNHPAPVATAPYRLFEEFSLVAANLQSLTQREQSESFWVGFGHLPPEDRAVWIGRWSKCPGLREVKPGSAVFRVPCTGAAAGAFRRAMERYPYSIAPSEKTDTKWAAAYVTVTERAGFAVPVVVRGDWLLAACFRSAELAQHLNLQPAESEVRDWGSEPLDAAWIFGEAPDEGQKLLTGSPTRAQLETTTGRGSLYVLWAQGAGLATPRN